MTAPKTPKAVRHCLCGCGATVTKEFRPGHDAKLKGALINQVLAAEAPKATKADKAAGSKALATLTARGWLAHLDKSRASRSAKAERAAARRAARAAARSEAATAAVVTDHPVEQPEPHPGDRLGKALAELPTA
ncbi:hypothetical protein [Parafrankia sp. EUN1f]|uniref:hypothetical protein n=1 Tax=Parafrankia sp. EUN1f TaxID=102897 RepID=UPI0001C44A7F|nr:hypothetical protein [Parafrankia sp. EUN1f]EFC84502.1 hypothetical protein FrEUN1fDRAFT_2432 [Parafrankia sp. EUN1f]